MKSWVYILFSLLLIFSCKKKTIQEIPTSNSPIFELNCDFDNQKYAAGVNNFQLITGVNSEFDTWIKSGSITNGSDGITFELLPEDIDLDHDDKIINNTYSFSKNTNFIVLSKDNFTNKNSISTINWYVDDQFSGKDIATITEVGFHTVCAQITFTDGTDTELCDEIQVGYQLNANYYIKAEFNSTYGHIEVSTEDLTNSVEETKWYINEKLISTEHSFTLDIGSSSCILTCEATFENGAVKTKSCYLNYKTKTNSLEDFTNFELQNSNKLIQDNHVRISYTKNGETYRSDIIDNSSNSITISEISEFGKSTNNNTIYKFKINGKVKLKSTTTNKELEGTISGTTGLEIN